MTEPSKNELAETRTDWAEDRTILANERTFAGWMRTGMSAIAIGLGFQAIFKASEPTWLAKVGATVFIVIGIIIFISSIRSSRRLMDRLQSHAAEPLSQRRLSLISYLFVGGSILLGIMLWLL